MSVLDFIYDGVVKDFGKEKIGMTTSDTRDDMVRRVRYIGESLIKNAESIVGTEEYVSGIKIQAFLDCESVPHIEVTKGFLPERAVEE